jgi:hypothetical protein
LGRVNRGLEIHQIIASPGPVSRIRKIGKNYPGSCISGENLEKGLEAGNY